MSELVRGLVWRVYGPAGDVLPCEDWRQAPALANASGGFAWLGLEEPQAAAFEEVAGAFGLPPLAVEDAVRAGQRPKLESYGDVVFVVVKPVRFDEPTERIEVTELALFLTTHALVGVRHGGLALTETVRAELDQGSPPAVGGPFAVLLRLLDLTVNGFDAAVAALEDDLEEIEAMVFAGDDGGPAARVYGLKRQVLELRRAVLPLVSPAEQLAGGEVPAVPGTLRHPFRDVHDRCLRAADSVDRADRLLSEVLQAHLAQVAVTQTEVGVRQNEDMRKISAWAAIALVPTAVAGIYGMNFDNMPELRTKYGYFIVLAVIATVCLALYRTFRQRGWL